MCMPDILINVVRHLEDGQANLIIYVRLAILRKRRKTDQSQYAHGIVSSRAVLDRLACEFDKASQQTENLEVTA
jgi:hypothetical protein